MPNDVPPSRSADRSTAWLKPSAPPPASAPPPLRELLRTGPHTDAGLGATDPKSAKNQRSGQRRPSAAERQPTPGTLHISLWDDPLLAEHGYPATGFYVERYYGPIVGPTCIVLYRSLARRLEADADGFGIVTAELARTVGCSSKSGAASQFWRALRRASRFGLLRQHENQIKVRASVGPMSNRMAHRLPLELRQEHRVWVEACGPTPNTTPSNPYVKTEPPSAAIELLRAAARGLCTPEELRMLDQQRRIL